MLRDGRGTERREAVNGNSELGKGRVCVRRRQAERADERHDRVREQGKKTDCDDRARKMPATERVQTSPWQCMRRGAQPFRPSPECPPETRMTLAQIGSQCNRPGLTLGVGLRAGLERALHLPLHVALLQIAPLVPPFLAAGDRELDLHA